MKHKLIKFTGGAVLALHVLNSFIDSTIIYTTENISGKTFEWTHGSVFYRVLGQGDPILLIHDLNIFASGNEWMEICDALAQTHTVYILDLLGCGRSDKPSTTYTAYLYVQLITAFIEKVIQEPPVVVASGLSSTFAMMTEALNPDLISSIQMINPPSLRSLRAAPDWRSQLLVRFFKIPVVSRSFYYMISSKTNAEDYLTEECFYNPFDLKQSAVRASYEAAHRHRGTGRYLYASLKGNYLNTDISAAIKRANKKITIIAGDHANAKDTAAVYHSLNENIQVEVIKDTKKLPQLEQPEKVASAILSAC